MQCAHTCKNVLETAVMMTLQSVKSGGFISNAQGSTGKHVLIIESLPNHVIMSQCLEGQ